MPPDWKPNWGVYSQTWPMPGDPRRAEVLAMAAKLGEMFAKAAITHAEVVELWYRFPRTFAELKERNNG